MEDDKAHNVEDDEEEGAESRMARALENAGESDEEKRRILLAMLAKLDTSEPAEMPEAATSPPQETNSAEAHKADDAEPSTAEEATADETSIPTTEDRRPSDQPTSREKTPVEHTGGEGREAGIKGDDSSDPG